MERKTMIVFKIGLVSFELAKKKTIWFSRRVHISEATLKYLQNTYEVEPGLGQTRDSFLRVSFRLPS